MKMWTRTQYCFRADAREAVGYDFSRKFLSAIVLLAALGLPLAVDAQRMAFFKGGCNPDSVLIEIEGGAILVPTLTHEIPPEHIITSYYRKLRRYHNNGRFARYRISFLDSLPGDSCGMYFPLVQFRGYLFPPVYFDMEEELPPIERYKIGHLARSILVTDIPFLQSHQNDSLPVRVTPGLYSYDDKYSCCRNSFVPVLFEGYGDYLQDSTKTKLLLKHLVYLVGFVYLATSHRESLLDYSYNHLHTIKVSNTLGNLMPAFDFYRLARAASGKEYVLKKKFRRMEDE